MNEPILSYDVPMGGDSPEWRQLGDYALWTMHRAHGVAPLRIWERQAGGQIELPERSHALYHIAAGVPHRIAPLFGFWRVSDGDTDIFKAGDERGAAYTILINTGAPSYRADRVAWFCQSCGGPLTEATFDVERYGVAAYWEAARAHVDGFNRDAACRTCAACGSVHPEAYDFAPREAAAAW